MVNSSRRAALRGRRRPGDTGRAGLAPHASQNTKYKKPNFRAQTEIAAGRRLPCPFPLKRGETDKGIAARTKDGGIAQLVERRLCKPNVAGSSPTASTSFSTKNLQVGGVARPGRVAQLVRARP